MVNRETGKEVVYWTKMDAMIGELYIAATDRGLAFVGSRNGGFDELTKWIGRMVCDAALVENEEKLGEAVVELDQYFRGEREVFQLPVDLRGTDFQKNVWVALEKIPYGQIQSYSDIALGLDKPNAVRAVGSAIGRNPLLIVVPCHRVLGKNGKLTGYRGGMEMKERLLTLEGKGKGVNSMRNNIEKLQKTGQECSIEEGGSE